jgi:DNA polymerase elongation subunit (family B)
MNTALSDASDFIVDIREYDVPYHVRVMIDLGKSFLPCGSFLFYKLYMMFATKYLLLQSL